MQMLFWLQRDLEKTQNRKYNLKQFGKISNYYFLSDDTLLFYHNVIDVLLLTNKLNHKCFVLYETMETKKLSTITKMYFTIRNILMFIISVTVVIIIIIIIIIIVININVITISIFIVIVKLAKSDNYLL